MRPTIPALLPLLVLAPPASAGGGTSSTVEDFTDGTNPQGFTFNAAGELIQTTNGNPGAFLRSRSIDTFAPILQSAPGSPDFSGDFRARGVTRISLDAFTGQASFGAAGRELSILLRDTKGTPLDPADDDYAYFVGSEVPQVGAGWVHYDFAIPSQSTDPVPAGWSGGYAGDLENFRPGVEWSDVITNVTQVEVWWLNPSFFAIFQTWDVGVDNLELETRIDASLSVRQGLPNPQSYTCTSPVLGGTVQATVDLTTTGHTTAFLVGFASPLDAALSGGQRLLVNLADPAGELLGLASAAGPSAVFDVPIPCDASLAGVQVHTQAIHAFGASPFALSNSQDWVLGD